MGPLAAGPLQRRQAYAAIRSAHWIHQIEFQLAGNHRPQAIGIETIQHAPQHMARIQIVGPAVEFIKRGDELRGLLPLPRRQHQRTRHRQRDAVRIAIAEHQPRVVAIQPGDVGNRHRDRKEAAAFIGGQHFLAPQPFAARHAGHRGEDHVEILHGRVRIEKAMRFVDIGDRAGSWMDWTQHGVTSE